MNTNLAIQTPPAADTYSGTLIEGWNEEASYDRLQFSGIIEPDKIPDIIQEGIVKLEDSPRTRMDLRLRTEITREELRKLFAEFTDFSDLEISAIFDQKDSHITELTVCQNTDPRRISNSVRDNLINAARKKNAANTIDFEETAHKALLKLRNEGYQFVSTGFQADEIFRLWNKTFGWTLQQCQDAIQSLNSNSQIHGLRDENQRLVAITLISTNGDLSESTEWAVNPELQGKGLIHPLLIYSNASTIITKPENIIWAHLRIDRSTSPGLKSGMKLFLPEANNGILTNHVTVGDNEQPDEHNQNISYIEGINARALRSFITAQVDRTLYTDRILEAYTNSNLIAI